MGTIVHWAKARRHLLHMFVRLGTNAQPVVSNLFRVHRARINRRLDALIVQLALNGFTVIRQTLR